jgi:hypothetical protein
MVCGDRPNRSARTLGLVIFLKVPKGAAEHADSLHIRIMAAQRDVGPEL